MRKKQLNSGPFMLRRLHQQHPQFMETKKTGAVAGLLIDLGKEMAETVSAEAALDDDSVLFSRSRSPDHHQKLVTPEVEEKILEIRDHPPANLARVPGPVAILYYLHRDEEMKQLGAYLPRST